jgi:hypothetical protein
MNKTKRTPSLTNLIDLVNCIVNYYNKQSDDFDPSEDWKRKCGIMESVIPTEVDTKVKDAFIKQLERFI